MVIRVATLSDLDDVLRLFGHLSDHHASLDRTHDVTWRNTEEAANYFEKRIQQGTVWVAVYETDIIGYLAGRISTRFLPIARWHRWRKFRICSFWMRTVEEALAQSSSSSSVPGVPIRESPKSQ